MHQLMRLNLIIRIHFYLINLYKCILGGKKGIAHLTELFFPCSWQFLEGKLTFTFCSEHSVWKKHCVGKQPKMHTAVKKTLTSATSVNMLLLKQSFWRYTRWHTMERSRTNAVCVILIPLMQLIWGFTLKFIMGKSLTNVASMDMLHLEQAQQDTHDDT